MVVSLKNLSIESVYDNPNIRAYQTGGHLTVFQPNGSVALPIDTWGEIQKEKHPNELFLKACKRGPDHLRIVMAHPDFDKVSISDICQGMNDLCNRQDLVSLQLLLNKRDIPGFELGLILSSSVNERKTKVAELLVQHPQCSNIRPVDLIEVFKDACHFGDVDLVRLLLRNNRIPRCRPYDFPSAFHSAVVGNHPEVVKVLIKCGGFSNISAHKLGSELKLASERGHEEIVQLLVESGRLGEIPLRDLGIALGTAIRRGHVQTAKSLLRTPQIRKECKRRINAGLSSSKKVIIGSVVVSLTAYFSSYLYRS